jgi:hypothetical protein
MKLPPHVSQPPHEPFSQSETMAAPEKGGSCRLVIIHMGTDTSQRPTRTDPLTPPANVSLVDASSLTHVFCADRQTTNQHLNPGRPGIADPTDPPSLWPPRDPEGTPPPHHLRPRLRTIH